MLRGTERIQYYEQKRNGTPLWVPWCGLRESLACYQRRGSAGASFGYTLGDPRAASEIVERYYSWYVRDLRRRFPGGAGLLATSGGC